VTLEAVAALLVLALGAVVGSFANVCIHRLPKGESVVSPPSHCPSCGHAVRPRDNVPVLAWLWLGGRCRDCRAPIPVRYPLVEAGVAILFLASVWLFGFTLEAASGAVLATAAVILAATDLEHRVLPDEVTIGGAALGLALAAFRGLHPFLESVLGAAAGVGVLLLIRAVYRALRGGEGMGLGDVKMAGMIGALSGGAGLLVTFLLASAAGALFGLLSTFLRQADWARIRRARRKDGVSGRRDSGLLVGPDGTIRSAGSRWLSIPGAAPPGAPPSGSGPAARPLVALLRLARRRRARGEPVTSCGRLVLEKGDFFRVLAARVEPARDGGSLLLLWRVDIPFGVFLAAGSLLAFALGRPLLTGALGWPASFLGSLLP
jgi:leader peptidase (prepilin peptidase)/N-methyltransferase